MYTYNEDDYACWELYVSTQHILMYFKSGDEIYAFKQKKNWMAANVLL